MANPARHPQKVVGRAVSEQAKATKDRTPAPAGVVKHPGTRLQSASARSPAAATNERIVSVDALRGFAIFWILGGDTLAISIRQMSAEQAPWLRVVGGFIGGQLEHVEWEGFTFYDLVFPMFIFVVGVSIVLALPKVVARRGKAGAHWRVLRRSALLFVLGLLYYGGISAGWPDVRLLGVLQRIALCYLFASLLFLNLPPKALIAACVALLGGYWALLTFVPVPGVGAGLFGPDENLAAWIDANYLPGWLWSGTRDPEGLLSTLPAIATCLMGVLAGLWLVRPDLSAQRKALGLIAAGAVMAALGYLWGLQFPIIKYIWTSSFALVAGGYSLIALGLMHLMTDVWRWRTWATPFVWIGANAILLYMLNNVINFQQFAARLVGGDVSAFLDWLVAPGAGIFVTALLALAFVILLARFLYRRKIFLRV